MDNNTKRFKQIDDRGKLDLTRVIEEQANTILIFERHLEEKNEEIEKLKKQVELLQNKIRDYKWKKTEK